MVQKFNLQIMNPYIAQKTRSNLFQTSISQLLSKTSSPIYLLKPVDTFLLQKITI